MDLAFSQACENNKQPILSVIKHAFASSKQVLEIGSGTGQHAIFFAKNLPQLTWLTSDLKVHHPSIEQRIIDSALTNIEKPIPLDLNVSWPIAQANQQLDSIFTANTLHIISEALVEKFFDGVKQHLKTNGCLCIYGPFNYQGQFTSESNANFDLWLKQRDKQSGIRDIERIIELATSADLKLIEDHAMPANNRLLEFRKG